jgi:amidase
VTIADSDELYWRPATELATMVRTRQVSARELLEAHLARIEAVNPALNAIVTLDAEGARAAADAADATACRSRTRTPTPPAACGRRGAHRCTPTPSRPTTSSWWHG